MRYAPTYNAPGFNWYQSENKNTKLDVIDLILLNEINELSRTWENINTKVFEGVQCFNISYSKLIEQLPGINIGTTDGMSNRLREGLIKEGLIKKFIDRSDNSKVYFTLTELGHKINSYQQNKTNLPDKEPLTSGTTDSEPPGRQTVNLPDDRPTNKNINNKSIKNKREYTHFNFLVENYSNEVESIFKKYPLSSDQKKFCIEKFNEKEIKKVSCIGLENYVSNWYDNIKDNSTNQTTTVNGIKFN